MASIQQSRHYLPSPTYAPAPSGTASVPAPAAAVSPTPSGGSPSSGITVSDTNGNSLSAAILQFMAGSVVSPTGGTVQYTLPVASTAAPGIVALSGSTPAAETFGAAGTAGTTGEAADAGHVHPMPQIPNYAQTTPVNHSMSPYTVLSTDSVLLIDTSAGAVTINMPAASAQVGRIIGGVVLSVANAITWQPAGADTILGLSSVTGTTLYGFKAFISDGVSNWDWNNYASGQQSAGNFFSGPATGAAAQPSWRAPVNTDLASATFAAAGVGHEPGAVPDPGAAAHGTPYYLGDDAAFHAIPSTGVTSVATTAPITGGPITGTGTIGVSDFVASGASHARGTVPDPGASAGSTRFLCENATFAVPPTAAATYGFTAWSSAVTYTYALGTVQIVTGSDGNLYVCQSTSSNVNPTTDAGVYWKLWACVASLTLACGGSATQFPDTFAASGSPGGAMTPGMQNAVAFLQAAGGPVSAPIVIQQSLNTAYTFSANANGSTTTIKTATNIPVGASILGTGGHNVGTLNTVTVNTYSAGTYTLTVTAMTSTVSGDTFQFAPYYGTSTISISGLDPAVSQQLTILGSTSNPVCPTFYPSLATASSSSGLTTGNYYNIGLTYTFTDASGTSRETMVGPVSQLQITSGTNRYLTVAGFTLPTGVTGVNVYSYTNSSATTYAGMFKQGSMSVSGGVASTFTMTTYASSTAAPTTDAPAATYPCAMMWGASTGVSIVGIQYLNIKGLYLHGPGSNSGLLFSNCAFCTTTNCVLSNWTENYVATSSQKMTVTGCQSDTAVNRGYYAVQSSDLTIGSSVALTTGYGVYGNTLCQVSCAGLCVSNSTNYGYVALNGSRLFVTPTNPSGGVAIPTYGAAQVSNFAVNTGPSSSTSGGSYIQD
jgi:hypothetical protein